MNKKKALILSAFLVLIIPIIFNQANADPFVSKTQRFKNYQIEDLGNGLMSQTIGMPDYVFDGTKYVDRIIQNNGTHFNVYSEFGSFSFKKNDCTVTQYVKGFDPINNPAHDSDIVIKNWFWTVARKPSGGSWNVLDASIFACSISTNQNSTGKYLTAQRDHATGSYLKITSAAIQDKNVEDFGEFYMNVPAWNGNKFAPILWAKGVNTNTLSYRNGTSIPIQNGITIINATQLNVKSMDFIKNNFGLFIDWSKMQSQFSGIIVNKTGSNIDLQFAFTKSSPILNTGDKMTWDPSFGYTSSGATNNMFYYSGTTGTKCTNSVGGTATRDTSDNLNMRLLSSGTGDGCQIPVPYWDISSIPTGRTVTQVDLRYDNGITTFTNMAARVCNFNQITHRPDTNTPTTMYQDAANISNGTAYLTDSTSCQTSGADQVVTLGSTANSDVQSRLGPLTATKGWFGVGMMINGTRDASAHIDLTASGAGTIDLRVIYTSYGKPFSITDLHATDYDTDTIDLAWTAPSLNNGTLQRYVINYTTPCAANPSTQLNGTTATTYTLSSLVANTCYSLRASAATQGGYNTTFANTINITTLAFNQANFTIGNLNFDADNTEVFPIHFERTDTNSTYSTLKVIYDKDFVMDCSFNYEFAMQTDTYHNITESVYSTSENYTNFNFRNPDNDIIHTTCFDVSTNETGRYTMSQNTFPLLEQIQNFRNGTYGTQGMIGAIDFITLAIIIFSTVAFSRINEAAAAVINIALLGALAHFDIIELPTLFLGGIAVIIVVMIASTRKD